MHRLYIAKAKLELLFNTSSLVCAGMQTMIESVSLMVGNHPVNATNPTVSAPIVMVCISVYLRALDAASFIFSVTE